ncbi:MAG: hypothetical protein NMNS01_30080 [Nitrosomonas sp.]|nr:MAG: hypothetical protein NMNS01_30080 [Nitrosomonas sp.]
MSKMFFIVFILFPFVSCGYLKDYKSVETGPRAKIIVNSKDSEMNIALVEPQDACNRDFIGHFKVGHNENEKSFFVRSGKRLNISLMVTPKGNLFRNYRPESQFFSFIPVENTTYKMEYIYLGIAETGTYSLPRLVFNTKFLEYDESGKEKEWDIEFIEPCKE